MTTRAVLLCLLGLSAAFPAFAAPKSYVVAPGSPNLVDFESSAPIEVFHGKSRALSGTIQVDPGALGDSVSAHFEIELATLSTGLPKRDKHMREDHLEVAKYPKAIFDGVALRGDAKQLTLGTKVPLDLEGTFTIHGTSRRIRLTVESTLVHNGKAEAIQFKTAFPVSLADYGIPRPQFLILRLADIQKVTVEGIAMCRDCGDAAAR